MNETPIYHQTITERTPLGQVPIDPLREYPLPDYVTNTPDKESNMKTTMTKRRVTERQQAKALALVAAWLGPKMS